MDKRSKALLKYEKSRSWFLKKGESLSSESRTKSPASDEWSFVELLEHLVLVEERFIKRVSNPDTTLPTKRPPLPSFIGRMVVSFVLNNGIKVPVPEGVPVPSGLSWEELIEKWNKAPKAVSDITSKIKNNSASPYFWNHPRAGLLTVDEGLKLLAAHANYHKIRASKFWPD